ISDDYLDPVEISRCEYATGTWLGRSGALPLTIKVTCDGEADEDNTLAIRVIKSLVNMSHRWEIIDIKAPWKLLRPLSLLSKQDTPLLESFTHLDLSGYPGTAQSCRKLWESMGVLAGEQVRALTLRCSYWAEPGSQLVVPVLVQLSNITYLSLQGWGGSSHETHHILTLCPNLEISISELSTFTPLKAFASHIFHHSDLIRSECFFSSLTLPQLAYFEYCFDPCEGDAPWLKLLERCNVENLSLSYSDLQNADVQAYLDNNHTIKRLRFQLNGSFPERRLKINEAKALEYLIPTICPLLETLEFDKLFSLTNAVECITKLIRNGASRAPLKQFRAQLNNRHQIASADEDQMAEIIAAGISVDVYYHAGQRWRRNICHWPDVGG
ncbi:hypothetical protein C8J56DRAFT_987043, partial [Mycena floridula]